MNMNFYVDFEATQPEQEIISIGVYSDNKESFYALVKPQFSKISKYITDMTGITSEMVEDRYDLDTALNDLYVWCAKQEANLSNWHFYSYGDGDIEFLKCSMCNIQTQRALIISSIMIATMKDFSKTVSKYFHGSTSLIKAFNYLKSLENKQKHNALEDAKMLAEIYSKIEGQTPLNEYPFHPTETTNNEPFTFPSGKFFCKALGKNAKEREFANILDAIDWLIKTRIGQTEKDKVHKDRMAIKIMKAIRKQDTYMGYKWRRDKSKDIIIHTDQKLCIKDTVFYGTEIETGHWVLPYPDYSLYVILGETNDDVRFIRLNTDKVTINKTKYNMIRRK